MITKPSDIKFDEYLDRTDDLKEFLGAKVTGKLEKEFTEYWKKEKEYDTSQSGGIAFMSNNFIIYNALRRMEDDGFFTPPAPDTSSVNGEGEK